MTGRLSFLLGFLPIMFGGLAARAALAPPLRLTLRNESAAAWDRKPITSGVMLPRGAVATTTSLCLTNAAGTPVPAQFLPTAWWPDHSLKWVLVDVQATLAAGARTAFYLATGTPAAVTDPLALTQTPDAIRVANGPYTLQLNRNRFTVVSTLRVVKAGASFYSIPFATPEADAFPSPLPGWTVEEHGPLKIVLRSDGEMMSLGTPPSHTETESKIHGWSGRSGRRWWGRPMERRRHGRNTVERGRGGFVESFRNGSGVVGVDA